MDYVQYPRWTGKRATQRRPGSAGELVAVGLRLCSRQARRARIVCSAQPGKERAGLLWFDPPRLDFSPEFQGLHLQGSSSHRLRIQQRNLAVAPAGDGAEKSPGTKEAEARKSLNLTRDRIKIRDRDSGKSASCMALPAARLKPALKRAIDRSAEALRYPRSTPGRVFSGSRRLVGMRPRNPIQVPPYTPRNAFDAFDEQLQR
jgi:hypothetical protein